MDSQKRGVAREIPHHHGYSGLTGRLAVVFAMQFKTENPKIPQRVGRFAEAAW